MQQITIDGFLSKDAETRQAGGNTVTVWNVPVRQGFGDKETTNWFRVNVWGKRADFASKAAKGDFVVVVGALKIGEYNGKPQFDIDASDFTLRRAKGGDAQSGSGRSESRTNQGNSGAAQSGGWGGGNAADLDDEIPF